MPPLQLVPLGDQAALAYFSREEEAHKFAGLVRRRQAPWLVDVVQAYASVAVFFNLEQADFPQAADYLTKLGADESDQDLLSPNVHYSPQF